MRSGLRNRSARQDGLLDDLGEGGVDVDHLAGELVDRTTTQPRSMRRFAQALC
jgi:hypothetical protein